MKFWIGIVIVFIILIFVLCYVVYDTCFSNNSKYMYDDDCMPIGEQYEPYYATIRRGVEIVRAEVFEEVRITSYDGLQLAGKYYHYREKAPVVIFFHGYRCSAIRDGNGLFRFAKNRGYNVLMVDQRAHGRSQGKTITFGLKERFDCLSWVKYIVEKCGEDTKILLTGISMGAATVLMASDVGLPENVKGIIADCPYSSPREIIRTVIKDVGFPVGLTYWLAKMGGRIFGNLKLEEASALEALKNNRLPVLLIHGDDDHFVPCSMSEDCLRAGQEHVRLVIIKKAGHGLCFCVNVEKYEREAGEFCRLTLGE